MLCSLRTSAAVSTDHAEVDASRRRREEGGYVLAMTALLFIPMMIFAAFAVDVGAWYQQANRTQRAADAAALAAVVWMPDEAAATQAALDVAALNGFTHTWKENTCTGSPSDASDCAVENLDGTKVTVERTDNQQVRVTIEEDGDVYFGNIVSGIDIRIERFATAEFVLPISMGNPTSTLGGGSDSAFGSTPNFWLNVLPRGTVRQSGDLISANNGNGGATNPSRDPLGYLFVVDMPSIPTTNTWELQVRSSCYRQNAGTLDFNLFQPDGTTFNDFDNIDPANLVATGQFNRNETVVNGTSNNHNTCGGTNSGVWSIASDPAPWVKVADVHNQTGRWVFQVLPRNGGGRSLYSVRIADSAGGICTRNGPSGDPDCPNISARNWLGAFTQHEMLAGGAGTPTELYMAEVGEQHGNKTLEIVMFDPADGVDEVKVIRPDGTFATFEWETYDDERWGYTAKWGADTDSGPYDQSASGTNVCSGGDSCVTSPTGDGNWFQDRTVRILVEVPPGYTCGTDCWWRLQYSNDGATNETTTWQARIIGDPVRLVE